MFQLRRLLTLARPVNRNCSLWTPLPLSFAFANQRRFESTSFTPSDRFLVSRIRSLRVLTSNLPSATSASTITTASEFAGASAPATLDLKATVALIHTLAAEEVTVTRLLADIELRLAALPESESRIRNDLNTLTVSLRDLNYKKKALALAEALDGKDLNVHNAILAIYASNGEFEAGLAYIKSFIDKHALQPNVDSFSHMIKAYGVAKNAVEAQKWFDVYRNSDEPTLDAPYNNLIAAYVNAGDIPAAINVMSVIMAEDSIPLTNVHITAFLDALLLTNNHTQVIEWYNRLNSDKTGQFPKPNDTILDIAFESAVHLKNESLIQTLWPTSATRSPSTLSLCQYGLWKLEPTKTDVVAATKVLNVLKENGNLVSPVLPSFFETFVEVAPAMKKEPKLDIQILETAAKLQVFPRILKKLLERAIMNSGGNVVEAFEVYSAGIRAVGEPSGAAKRLLLDLYLEHGVLKADKTGGAALEERHFEVVLPIAAWYANATEAVLNDLKARGIKVSKKMNEAVLENLRDSGKENVLNAWISRMRKAGVIRGPRLDGELLTMADLRVLNDKILTFARERNIEAALDVYMDILPTPLNPSIQAISSLIITLFAAKRVNEALVVAKEMLEKTQTSYQQREYDFAIHDALMAGHLSVNDFPASIAAANHITQTLNRLPFHRTISKLISRATFHHQSPEKGSPDLAPLDLVATALTQWLKFMPTPLLPTEKNPKSPFHALTLNDMIYILCKGGQTPQEALNIYYTLRDAGYPPRPITHKTLIESVANSPSMDKSTSMELLDDAMDHLSNVEKGSFGFLSGSWFSPVLEMHVNRYNDLESAMSVWRVMKWQKLAMDKNCSILMAEKCLEKGDYASVVEFLSGIFLDKKNNRVPVALVEAFFEKCGDQVDTVVGVGKQRLHVAGIVEQRIGSEEVGYSQRVLEGALRLVVKEKGGVESAGRLASALLKSYKFIPNIQLGTDLAVTLASDSKTLSVALQVLESMSPYSATAATSRTIEAVSAVVYNAVKQGNEQVATRVLEIAEADGFSAEEISSIKEGVELIRIAIKG
ncbi:UNVERIFIED_CONTAM: hypothetical protein HDU68_002658 [Siphonaria sp. JEL0065]|nr:hypothetical protein HDU68_002658 [Siphonaria sp. JEL0065]